MTTLDSYDTCSNIQGTLACVRARALVLSLVFIGQDAPRKEESVLTKKNINVCFCHFVSKNHLDDFNYVGYFRVLQKKLHYNEQFFVKWYLDGKKKTKIVRSISLQL